MLIHEFVQTPQQGVDIFSIISSKAKQESLHNRVKTCEAPGRRWDRVAGGWISDLVALEKAICLCDKCQHKFAHAKVNYEKVELFANSTFVISNCNGCKSFMTRCKLYTKCL